MYVFRFFRCFTVYLKNELFGIWKILYKIFGFCGVFFIFKCCFYIAKNPSKIEMNLNLFSVGLSLVVSSMAVITPFLCVIIQLFDSELYGKRVIQIKKMDWLFSHCWCMDIFIVFFYNFLFTPFLSLFVLAIVTPIVRFLCLLIILKLFLHMWYVQLMLRV